jgi:DNA (cytosine-5)-methyltransferase 1
MKVLDLFSGIGGFSLGLERAGFETAAFCEREPFCQAVLKKHWPDVPIIDDVRNIKGDEFDHIDIIAGGFPCTQTSVGAAIHGKRAGLDGKDSGLWYEYLRIVRTIRPLWVIVENPGGVKKWEGEIQGGLEGAGYRVSRLEIKANDCGLPHIRRRYFYVANRDGKGLEIARRPEPPATGWATRLAAAGGSWLRSTPGIVGVFNGLPNRVDRVRALGNTVCPDKAEMIGEAIAAVS